MSSSKPPFVGESKTVSELSATSVYSSTNYVSAVLANPLSVRATVLHKPEFHEEYAPELVEEGDILFDVLANPLVYPAAAIVQEESPARLLRRSSSAALATPGVSTPFSLPSTIGQHFVGEPFRAFLSFHNAATYPLSNLVYRISCLHPTQQSTLLVEYDCPRLDAKSNASFRVEHTLTETGQHTLQVNASFTDSSNEFKRLTWSSSFIVNRAITEMHRELRIIPVMTRPVIKTTGGNGPGNIQSLQLSTTGSTLKDVVSNITLPTRKFLFSMSLKNTSTLPLTLTSIKFSPGAFFELLSPPKRLAPLTSSSVADTRRPWWPASAEEPKENDDSFRARYTGGGTADSIEDFHMQPGDVRRYCFELFLRPDCLRNLPTCHGSAGAKSAVALSNFTEMGHVEWCWRRANSDGGSERGRLIRLSRLTTQQPIEMFVIGTNPKTPQAGQPVALECVAVNYSSENRVDLALRVRPEKLLLEMLVYAGPLLCPLGLIEPRGTLLFRVSLVPWRQGWTIVQGGLELCDARAPESLLWPVRPLTTQPPPLSSTAAPEVMEAPEQPYPPVLCEMLVY